MLVAVWYTPKTPLLCQKPFQEETFTVMDYQDVRGIEIKNEDRRLWQVSWRSQLWRHYLSRSELYSSQRSNNLSRCQHGLHGDVHEVQLVVAVIVWSHEKGDSYILKE